MAFILMFMKEDQSIKNFKEQLEKHHVFPGPYTFKFIIPAFNIHLIKKILPEEAISQKPSKKGKYISITAKLKVESSDDVIRIYEKASHIEGIIQL